MKPTHVCSCLIAVGALLAPALAESPPPGHGFHPVMPDQKLYFQCQRHVLNDEDPAPVEVAMQLPSPATATKLDQLVNLPAPCAPIRLTQYLPQASLEQDVQPDEGAAARPAVQISINGPTQSFRRWLLADDAERNRLISFIGTWRYMSAAGKRERDDLFPQFRDELTREPKLLISQADGSHSHELRAAPGAAQTFSDLGCKVRVRSFYPHYALDDKSRKPVNQSDKRLNPAALVEIEHEGAKEERWVFAKFPDFKGQGRTSLSLPYQVTLDCPLEKQDTTPDYLLVTVGRAAHEVWVRHGGKTTAKPIAINDRIEIRGSQYVFFLARFVPSGRLIEEYRPITGKGGVPALRIEVVGTSGAALPVWLESGKPRTVTTPSGPVVVAFGPHVAASGGQPKPSHERE